MDEGRKDSWGKRCCFVNSTTQNIRSEIMELDDILVLKTKLEIDILHLVHSFETITNGCIVEDIYIERVIINQVSREKEKSILNNITVLVRI